MVGCGLLAVLLMSLGVAGYLGSVAAITFAYAAFQTSNNAAVLRGVSAEERGVVSGMMNLSRILGLITGACYGGGVCAWGWDRPAVGFADGGWAGVDRGVSSGDWLGWGSVGHSDLAARST